VTLIKVGETLSGAPMSERDGKAPAGGGGGERLASIRNAPDLGVSPCPSFPSPSPSSPARSACERWCGQCSNSRSWLRARLRARARSTLPGRVCMRCAGPKVADSRVFRPRQVAGAAPVRKKFAPKIPVRNPVKQVRNLVGQEGGAKEKESAQARESARAREGRGWSEAETEKFRMDIGYGGASTLTLQGEGARDEERELSVT